MYKCQMQAGVGWNAKFDVALVDEATYKRIAKVPEAGKVLDGPGGPMMILLSVNR